MLATTAKPLTQREGLGLPINALCAIMPPMSPEEERELDSSLLKHGLRHAITLWRHEVIDGRSRQAACLRTGVPARYVKWRPMAVTEREIQIELSIFIMVENLHRRHGLTQSQKAMVAGSLILAVSQGGRPAKPAESSNGKPVTPVTGISLTQGQAADAAGVSRKLMNEAAQVLRQSPSPIQQAVSQGIAVAGRKQRDFISAGDAANILDLKPAAKQLACLKFVVDGKARTLTAARAKLFEVPTRTGMSKKTARYVGTWELEEFAESPDLYEETIRMRNEGGILKAVALAGQPQKALERCHKCGKLLFDGDARMKNTEAGGWQCRECPGGRDGRA